MATYTRTYRPQKTATLGLRLRPEIKATLERQAVVENKTISALAEECIADTLRRRGLMK